MKTLTSKTKRKNKQQTAVQFMFKAMDYFTNIVVTISLVMGISIGLTYDGESGRMPSGFNPNYLLKIKKLQFNQDSETLKELENNYIRVSFKERKFEFHKETPFTLERGESLDINQSLLIDRRWVEEDKLDFTIEVVKKGIIDFAVVRCAQISKKLSVYNRNYECSIPGEDKPFLTYRVEKTKKNSVLPVAHRK